MSDGEDTRKLIMQINKKRKAKLSLSLNKCMVLYLNRGLDTGQIPTLLHEFLF